MLSPLSRLRPAAPDRSDRARDRQLERGAAAGLDVDGDLAAEPLHRLAHDIEPDAAPGHLRHRRRRADAAAQQNTNQLFAPGSAAARTQDPRSRRRPADRVEVDAAPVVAAFEHERSPRGATTLTVTRPAAGLPAPQCARLPARSRGRRRCGRAGSARPGRPRERRASSRMSPPGRFEGDLLAQRAGGVARGALRAP